MVDLIFIFQKSWEAVERETFTSDITPLVLAAHRNNYEIIKIILDRGTSPVRKIDFNLLFESIFFQMIFFCQIPAPHDARCGCKDCRLANKEGSL
jgi:transient receptor potential cation channel subfamily C